MSMNHGDSRHSPKGDEGINQSCISFSNGEKVSDEMMSRHIPSAKNVMNIASVIKN